MFRSTALIIIFFSSVTAFAQNQPKNSDKFSDQLHQQFNKLADDGLSGSILITHRNKTIFEKSYGYANKKDKLLNTSETLYDIGSITKPFTATLVPNQV